MLISVVIPAYNASAFIAETLASVLRQTVAVHDILVVDDGSTDDTAIVAASFPAPVRVISIANSKLGAARNFGVSQVSTDWVAFLDADDIWKENKLERQMEVLKRDHKCDLCYTRYEQFRMGPEGMVLGPLGPEVRPKVADQSLLENNDIAPSTVMIRKSVFLAVGGFSADLGGVEDWDLWLRLILGGVQFAACPEPLLLYRIHHNSMTFYNRLGMAENAIRLHTRLVRPHLRGPSGWVKSQRFRSRQRAWAAWYLVGEGDPRAVSVMMKSVLSWPFGLFGRHKAVCRLLLKQFSFIG